MCVCVFFLYEIKEYIFSNHPPPSSQCIVSEIPHELFLKNILCIYCLVCVCVCIYTSDGIEKHKTWFYVQFASCSRGPRMQHCTTTLLGCIRAKHAHTQTHTHADTLDSREMMCPIECSCGGGCGWSGRWAQSGWHSSCGGAATTQ